MATGSYVSVYPHGSPELAVVGHVVLLSANGLSIAVALGDPPGFKVSGDGALLHPTHGIMLLAHRVKLNGKPWGPWIEILNKGHFEIEELTNDAIPH